MNIKKMSIVFSEVSLHPSVLCVMHMHGRMSRQDIQTKGTIADEQKLHKVKVIYDQCIYVNAKDTQLKHTYLTSRSIQ